MHWTTSAPVLAIVLLLLGSSAQADWLTDGGLPQLQAELGSSMPTGAGVTVLMTEADTDGSEETFAYMPEASATSPFAGTGIFAGKTFTIESTPGGASGHAFAVGINFFSFGGASPGITDIHLMLADDYYFNLPGTTTAPATFPGKVSNHSWVGDSTGNMAVDNRMLRAHDFMINRDNVVTCVPLNNNTAALPAFLGNSYNVIAVGLRNGIHSRGGTTADGLGRMKPDLVVDQNLTSLASPSVASAAAMLLQVAVASHPAADNPQTIKSILLAGASKDRLLGWSRASAAAPYDAVFGAGDVNLLNSYHILAKGQQTPSASIEASSTGWDHNTTQISTAKRYFFTVPANSYAASFSAALTWHRTVTRNDVTGAYTSVMPNLNLKLYASNGFTVSPTPVDQSVSTVDNVEHVFLRNLPPGQYAMEVSSDTNGTTYGLAWETQRGSGPTVNVRKEAGDTTYVDFAKLDPLASYSIRTSPDLVNWTTAATVRTADTTPSTTYTWQDTETPVPTRKFYKLEWTAVR